MEVKIFINFFLNTRVEDSGEYKCVIIQNFSNSYVNEHVMTKVTVEENPKSIINICWK